MTHDELVDVLDTLTAVMMESGWRAWIADASKSVYVMFAVTYACCNIPASRLTEWRGEHGLVTMQMLEADGVVVLLLPGVNAPTLSSNHASPTVMKSACTCAMQIKYLIGLEPFLLLPC